jgi:hypothetical protein
MIEWTEKILEKLGTVPDCVIASEIGCSQNSVSAKRKALGIRAVRLKHTRFNWEEILKHMDKDYDRVVADKFGVSVPSVSVMRKRAGIQPKRISGRRREFTDEMRADFPTMRMADFAKKHKCSASWARYKAIELGLEFYNPNWIRQVKVPEWAKALIGDWPDSAIADAAGVSRERIRQLRELYNLPVVDKNSLYRKLLKEKLDSAGIEHNL